MKLSLALISTSFLIAIEAASIKFNVVAPSATDVKVSVNGQQIALTASDPNVPYFTGSAEIGSATTYKYVAAGVEEPFNRSLDSSKASTLNDFYNRTITYANIPQLPWPITTDPTWIREGARPAIFDDNYIPSIFFSGDAATIDNIVKNVPKDRVTGTITFIGADYVQTFGNVDFGLHGPGKKHNNAKQAWNWSLQNGDSFANRTFFKLRHMEEDPTQIRERLYSDVLHALGTYANRANMIRLFINGQGFGTFNLLDDVTKYSYINAMFHGGKEPATKGSLFDGQSGADFAYHPGNSDGYSSWAAAAGSPEIYTALDPLCKTLNETNFADNNAVSSFEQMFDTEHFLRFMVMEYLAAHWDGYWMGQTNDGAYKNAVENNKWYFLDQDFDGTFGVNLAVSDGPAFLSVSYKEWSSRFPGAVMASKLLQNPDKKAKFESYLTETVRVLFNNVTLTNRVLALHEFLLPDLQWDRSINQQSPGINFGWNFEQVTQNLWEGVSAPNANGGGAAYGLVQWIVERSQAVAKEFNISIVSQPMGPPTTASSLNKTNSTASTNQPVASFTPGVSGNMAVQSTKSTSSATTNIVPASAALVAVSALFAAFL